MSKGIYFILNVQNGKVYVGQSISIERRFGDHKSALRNNHHKNNHLQSAWNKYGENSFRFCILEECSDESLDENEVWWIDYFDSMNRDKGYNLESGGNSNKVVSKETREKMSELMKGKNHPNYGVYGKNHSRYGKSHSDSTKLKMSKAHNSTGYYRVTKMNSSSCKQGFRWGYSYYEDRKRKLISSINIEDLEDKVKSKGLPWFEV